MSFEWAKLGVWVPRVEVGVLGGLSGFATRDDSTLYMLYTPARCVGVLFLCYGVDFHEISHQMASFLLPSSTPSLYVLIMSAPIEVPISLYVILHRNQHRREYPNRAHRSFHAIAIVTSTHPWTRPPPRTPPSSEHLSPHSS